jgi:RND family efflux transporter MFP subunit
MKTRTIGITASIGLGLAVATAFQARSAAVTATAPRVAAAAGAAGHDVAAEGRVVTYPGAEVRVSAERGGRIVRLDVQEGDPVRAGQVLAEIESDELRAALAEARGRVSEAEAEVRLAELVRDRRRRLLAEQIVSAHDADEADRDLDRARARIVAAQADAARYEAQLRKSRIVAPLSGTVTARHVDAGETVETGDAVVTVADLRRLRVDAEADEADAGSLAVGSAAAITADGYPGQAWKGRVEEVADSVTLRKLKPQDPSRPTDTRILAVKVAFDEPSPLRLGTTVELKIRAASR